MPACSGVRPALKLLQRLQALGMAWSLLLGSMALATILTGVCAAQHPPHRLFLREQGLGNSNSICWYYHLLGTQTMTPPPLVYRMFLCRDNLGAPGTTAFMAADADNSVNASLRRTSSMPSPPSPRAIGPSAVCGPSTRSIPIAGLREPRLSLALWRTSPYFRRCMSPRVPLPALSKLLKTMVCLCALAQLTPLALRALQVVLRWLQNDTSVCHAVLPSASHNNGDTGSLQLGSVAWSRVASSSFHCICGRLKACPIATRSCYLLPPH